MNNNYCDWSTDWSLHNQFYEIIISGVLVFLSSQAVSSDKLILYFSVLALLRLCSFLHGGYKGHYSL